MYDDSVAKCAPAPVLHTERLEGKRGVSFVMGETWDPDGGDADSCPDNYAITFAKEFRYDTGRARYMVRDLDTAWLTASGGPFLVALSTTWTAYDGDEPYGDYEVAGGNVTETNAYAPGLWRSIDGIAEYLHGDHLGTLRLTTDAAGQATPRRIYTAFGEPIASQADRFGYVGAWGYQWHEEFPFLHIGARYYDAGTGRFLQRDRIGIQRALNIYAYLQAIPTIFVDPKGMGAVFGSFGPDTTRPFYEAPDLPCPINPLPNPNYRDPRFYYYDDMQQDMFEYNCLAWAAGVVIGAGGIVGPVAGVVAVVGDAISGLYALWPIN